MIGHTLVGILGYTAETKPTPPTADATSSYVVTVILALISSAGFWGTVTWLLGIRERRRKAELDEETRRRGQQEAEDDTDRRRREYDDLLVAAQKEAQRTALESSKQRYDALEADYRRCNEALREVRMASFRILDLLESFAAKLTPLNESGSFTVTLQPEEVEAFRDSAREARATLYDW